MTFSLRLISALLGILSLHLGAQPTSSHQFSRQHILDDLAFLYEALESTHFDLYAHVSEAAFRLQYNNALAAVQSDSLSAVEATSIFQTVISAANTGHAEIDFPAPPYLAYAQSGGTVFPLEIALEDGSCLVRKNFTTIPQIKPGAELLTINDQPIAEVLSVLYPSLSAETTYFKNAKLELWTLPRLYWQHFGQQDSFSVEVKIDGKHKAFTLPAIRAWEDYEMVRTDILRLRPQFRQEGTTAYLLPGQFGGDEANYRRFIDSAFVAMQTAGSKRLIIDLRNNPGGNNAFSDYLVAYLADRPFHWNAKFRLKTSRLLKEATRLSGDTTNQYAQQILAHPNGSVYPYYFEPTPARPEEQRFTGKVYVLINRQTHSQAAVTAAQIQDYGFGLIVGEETGDHPTLHASQFSFSLPRTGVVVKVPKGYMVRISGSEAMRGVVPDLKVRDHLLDERDEIMEFLHNLLAQQDGHANSGR